ncbi:hypothetical protein TSOC_002933 [Tetrabaena socialis]|uniref:Uncharacterized protein n=1 Tax=Tetrabaena socialis TaxID=47790 RepID=A0A2J8ACV8_9CHLO|nr:hypothetical protein TSOC_002933 [Tetrabaena socialis]|eukprot:PNH10351.1 hypothetical protein TSOC_002933 [Tetrabaena socialis]
MSQKRMVMAVCEVESIAGPVLLLLLLKWLAAVVQIVGDGCRDVLYDVLPHRVGVWLLASLARGHYGGQPEALVAIHRRAHLLIACSQAAEPASMATAAAAAADSSGPWPRGGACRTTPDSAPLPVDRWPLVAAAAAPPTATDDLSTVIQSGPQLARGEGTDRSSDARWGPQARPGASLVGSHCVAERAQLEEPAPGGRCYSS